MSKNARDFRRLLRLSIASLSIASVNGLVLQADAQQGSAGYADAVVLPKYYPGIGRVMVLGGIESAPPVTRMTVSHTQVASPLQSSGENKFTFQATVSPDQKNQVKVVILQQPLIGAAAPIEVDVAAPQGEIIRLMDGGQLVWLNIGRADGLQEGVPFSVIAADIVKTTKATPKARLFVTSVTGPHSSQAKATDLNYRNPILTGDKVYSPAWRSGLGAQASSIATLEAKSAITSQILDQATVVVATQVPTPALVEAPKPLPPQTTPPQSPQIQTHGFGQKTVVEPNQDSQLRRRTGDRDANLQQSREVREVHPQRDQPRVVQGVPLNPANRDRPNSDQPNRNEDQARGDRREPAGSNDSDRQARPEESRADGPNSRRPGPGGPGFNPGAMPSQGPGRGPDQGPDQGPGRGPWMRGGMDGGPPGDFNGPNNMPNSGPSSGPWSSGPSGFSRNQPPNEGARPDLESMDRIFNSPAVRQFLQLKEENLQLKAELKMKERELEMKMEMTEMRLRMHMQEAEKRVDQANQQLAEMKERAEHAQQQRNNASTDEEAARQRAGAFQRMRDSGMFGGAGGGGRGGSGFPGGFEAARPERPEQLLLALQEAEKDALSRFGPEHPAVDTMRKRISAVREEIALLAAGRADGESGKDREDSQKSLERVTQERNRVVAELESVQKQNTDFKHKLEAVAQEKMNAAKSLVEAERFAEKQIEKAKIAAAEAVDQAEGAAKQADAHAAKVQKEAEAKKSEAQEAEMKKAEAAKKEEAKKEKGANRKKNKDRGDEDEEDEDMDEEDDDDEEDMDDEDDDDEVDDDDEDDEVDEDEHK